MEKFYLLNAVRLLTMIPSETAFSDPRISDQIKALIDQGYLCSSGEFIYLSTLGLQTIDAMLTIKRDLDEKMRVFSHFDPQTGEFALEKSAQLSGEQWHLYASLSRWRDLRLAVCEYFDPDSIEERIFLLVYLFEDRIENGWQNEISKNLLTKQINHIKKSFISWYQLGDDAEQSETIIKQIISCGNAVRESLKNPIYEF